MKAVWKEYVLAESSETVVVEGNHYFPSETLNAEFFRESGATSFCPWKGVASYYDILVEDEISEQAAWYYPSAKEKAKHIEGMVAFWRGVEIVE